MYFLLELGGDYINNILNEKKICNKIWVIVVVFFLSG